MLSRQRDHVFRPQLANPSGHRDLNTFANFFWSTRLYYVVALSLSRSYKIVGCPALSLSTAMLLLLLLGFLTWRVSFPSCLSCCSWGSCNNNINHSYWNYSEETELSTANTIQKLYEEKGKKRVTKIVTQPQLLYTVQCTVVMWHTANTTTTFRVEQRTANIHQLSE